jgi:hypothetical protein
MSVNTNTQTERRIVYAILLLAVALPLVFPIGWKTEASPIVKMAWDLVEETPAGKVVLLSFDYEASTVTELNPMAVAIIEHAWSKGLRIVATALWPQGSKMATMAFDEAKKKYKSKQNGIDYVNLGYKPGGMVTILALTSSIKEIYPSDDNGVPIDKIPIMKGINRLSDITWICSLSSGTPGLKEWVMIAHDKHNIPVTGGTTAVSAPGFLPYVNEQQQLTGLLGGLKAAAEYEILIDKVGPATVKMDAQSIAHILILLLILLGNIKAYRRRHAVSIDTGGNNG